MNAEQFAAYFRGLGASKQPRYYEAYVRTCAEFSINTARRECAFVANVKHETGGFRWLVELWGPTSSQVRYEPPADLARRLGNTQPGDGYRYRGRGWFQLTGRHNYTVYGQRLGLGLRLELHPELASGPDAGSRIAGLYWTDHGCNALADVGNFDGVCDSINRGRPTQAFGDSNGWADRLTCYQEARLLLGDAA